ncbi:hypothetical protein DITRI_Ditri16bG0083400 [Diplodiscus trichospermus]
MQNFTPSSLLLFSYPVLDGNDFSHPLPSPYINTSPLKQICLATPIPSHTVMLDHRHGLAQNPISSFNPSYQIHSNCDGTGDIEFDFWSARKTLYYDSFNNLDGCEIEFQFQACVEDSFGDCPSPLWGPKKETDSSPLLSNNHFCINLSPRARRQAIEEGKKQLMEMIRNMPESTYELSLKDIVDKQQSEAVKVEAVSEDKSFHLETDSHATKQRTKERKKRKAGPLCRTGSMDADNFLIKMFFPCCPSLKKKSITENSSKVSPTPSGEGSEKHVDKQRWFKRIFIPKNHKNREDSSNKSSTSRPANRSSLPGCWLFFLSKKNKAI